MERTAPFFAARFPSMRWSILTPDGCARWDGDALDVTPGIERHLAPTVDDGLEDLWRTYYAGIFNPARLNRRAMRAEMPQRYWKHLPEAQLIASLARDAPARVARMIEQTLAPPAPLPDHLEASSPTLPTLVRPTTRRGTRSMTRDGGKRGGASDSSPSVFLVGCASVTAQCSAGVAGWTDPSILLPGVFYPKGSSSAEGRLRYYADQLPMVEVDATYYALPSETTAQRWVERTPAHFSFNIKAHALMTGHPTAPDRLPPWLRDDLPSRLRAARNVYSHHFPGDVLDEVWKRFLSALSPLRAAGKLGAVMLQFPKWFTPSADSLAGFERARERLGDCPASVEVRHRSWLEGSSAADLFDALREQRLSYVCVDAPGGWESSVPPTMCVTNPELAIVRLHGRRSATWEQRHEDVAERYRYLYSGEQLAAWLDPIGRAFEESQRVHLIFNNNKWNYATTNALEMNALVAASGS